MDFVNDIIARKRDGDELDEARMRAFVDGVVDGSVPAYQASALLMAIVLRGSRRRRDASPWRGPWSTAARRSICAVLGRPVLDKHSSGGVGDKVTLVLAPLVASCGALFGKMSGRGLGHTGGTLDKLESIPGFRVQLSQGDFLRQLERIGVAVVSQSERLVPADRILYALRDVTGDGRQRGPDRRQHHGQEDRQRHVGARARPHGGRGRLHADLAQARDARAPLPADRRALRAPDDAASTRRWTRRWVAPSATGSRSRRPGRCSAATGPTTCARSSLDAGRRAAAARRSRDRRGRGRRRAEARARRRPRGRVVRALGARAGRALEAGRVPPAGLRTRSRRRATAG